MTLFTKEYAAYLAQGYSTRAIPRGSKRPNRKGWQKPDSEQPANFYEQMANNPHMQGIALLLGTPFPDGTSLGALDVDHDAYVPVARFLLGDPVCGRFGSKGIAFPVRIRGQMKGARTPFDVTLPDDTKVHVGELLTKGSVLVLPPTIHPTTDRPYEWVGQPLLDTSFEKLPIIEV